MNLMQLLGCYPIYESFVNYLNVFDLRKIYSVNHQSSIIFDDLYQKKIRNLNLWEISECLLSVESNRTRIDQPFDAILIDNWNGVKIYIRDGSEITLFVVSLLNLHSYKQFTIQSNEQLLGGWKLSRVGQPLSIDSKCHFLVSSETVNGQHFVIDYTDICKIKVSIQNPNKHNLFLKLIDIPFNFPMKHQSFPKIPSLLYNKFCFNRVFYFNKNFYLFQGEENSECCDFKIYKLDKSNNYPLVLNNNKYPQNVITINEYLILEDSLYLNFFKEKGSSDLQLACSLPKESPCSKRYISFVEKESKFLIVCYRDNLLWTQIIEVQEKGYKSYKLKQSIQVNVSRIDSVGFDEKKDELWFVKNNRVRLRIKIDFANDLQEIKSNDSTYE